MKPASRTPWLALAWLILAGTACAQQSPPAARMECPATAEPTQQPTVALVLAGAYPNAVTGRLTLAFTHSADTPGDDPAIQFAGGARTTTVSIPAGSTRAEAALQSGTVAGAIRITAALEAAGADVTPSPPPACTITVPRRAPAVTQVRVEYTATGFSLYVTGYSTPRQVLEARFRFLPKPGYKWAPIEVVIPPETLSARFINWYWGGSAAQYGSQFTLLQPFTADQNMHSIGSVYVSLRNQEGTSPEYSEGFR